MATSEKAINFIQGNLERGQAIPGQSLTNSPDQPYNWEKPAEYSNPREAMLYVFETLTVPETTTNVLLSLSNGVGVIDIASITLYSGFLEGKWNPDLMTMLMEPTMYMIMALSEKANIKYVVDSGDDEQEPEITSEQQEKSFKKGLTALEEIKKETVKKINPQAIPVEIREKLETIELPKGLLDRKERPESLLNKEDV